MSYLHYAPQPYNLHPNSATAGPAAPMSCALECVYLWSGVDWNSYETNVGSFVVLHIDGAH